MVSWGAWDKLPELYNIDPMRCSTGFWHVGCFMDFQQLRKVAPHGLCTSSRRSRIKTVTLDL